MNNNSQNNSQNNTQNNSQNKNYQVQKKVSIMDLEKLKIEYSSQLNAYKQAIADYVNYLQQNAEPPCNSYSSDSTGISQACYNDIWKKAGCGTGNVTPDASDSWGISQTLDALINNSWLWATETDSEYRDGCYGPNNTNYNTATEPNFNINAPPMTTMPGKAFWGSGSLSISTGGTVEQCQALCATTSNCSGATFNPTAYAQPMCFLRTGEGQVVPALDTDVAIIPEGQKYLLIIESINKKLIETNQKIQDMITKSEPAYNNMQTEVEEKNIELIKNYMQLVKEREKITEALKSHESLEQNQNQSESRTNQKQYSYVLLGIIAFGVIILLYKFSGTLTSQMPASSQFGSQNYIQTGGEIPQPTYYILLLVIIIIIIIKYFRTIKNTTTQTSTSIFNKFSSSFSGLINIFSLNDN